MVFNRKKNWTFRRLIKTSENPGTKIFNKLARSVENHFKSNEPVPENAICMSDLSASMDSLNYPLKTSSEKSFKIEKSVHFDLETKDHQPKQVEQYLELCKTKVYVTPSIQTVTLVDVHNNQKEASGKYEDDFNKNDDCYKSLLSLQDKSLQDISGSTTYLTIEDASRIDESLQSVLEDEFLEVYHEDFVENQDVKLQIAMEALEGQSSTMSEDGKNENLGDESQVPLADLPPQNPENLKATVHDEKIDLVSSPKSPVETNNLLQANQSDASDNEKIEYVYTSVSTKQLPQQTDFEEVEEVLPPQDPEKLHGAELDLIKSSVTIGQVILPQFKLNADEENPALNMEPERLEENLSFPKSDNYEFKTQQNSIAFRNVEDDLVASKQLEPQPEIFVSRRVIDIGDGSPHHVNLEGGKGKERKSLVKNMIKLFSQNTVDNSRSNHHDVAEEIPLDLVRQRILQFSKEAEEISSGVSREEISQSLVKQRIQQLLSDANLEKIFAFHPAKFTQMQVDAPQVITAIEKSVQTEGDFPRASSKTNSFIRDLQLLLNLSQANEEVVADDDDYAEYSDGLEDSDHQETGNLLRRSFAVEDLSHLGDLNLEVQGDLISNSDDGEQAHSQFVEYAREQSSPSTFTSGHDEGDGDSEQVYSQFAGYAREQSSPSNYTPDHYEVIPESEADYLTPIALAVNMPVEEEEESVVRRNEEITRKFVVNLYESGQRRSSDSGAVALKKPTDSKIIHSENVLHIKDVEAIGDKKHANQGNVNRRSSEGDNGLVSRRVDSVNVGGNNCIDVEVPTKFYRILESSDTEADANLTVANGGVEMEEDIYVSVGDADDESPKSDDEIYFGLKHDADVQGIIMQQASKAVETCRNSRSFLAGKELLEAERILLVSSCKYELLRNEIQKAKYDTLRPKKDHGLGNITIDNLFLQLQLNEQDFIRYNHYYILVLSAQDKVFSTKVVEGNPMNYANFEDSFTFQDLPSDFTITIDIYGLKMKKSQDKSRLSKKFKTKNKLDNLGQKKRVFYKDLQTVTLMETSVAQSSFALCGSVTVTLEDINNTSCPIKNPCNTIGSKMNLGVSVSAVRIGGEKKGFLTVGSEVNGQLAWNRRWCVLDGPTLKFFNYPGDEDLVRPAVTLDFKHCFSGGIEMCDRERCAKSRTMLLKTKSMVKGMPEAVGHFLSADTRKDLLEWQSKINAIVQDLTKWNQLSY